MHFHLEVIMPPTDNVKEALKQIMEPFYEGGEDEDGNRNAHPFYDYYVIGGRWNGDKILSNIKQDDLDKFHEVLKEKRITVSGLQFGKQTLNPPSQIPMVDQLWNKYFPDCPIKICPLFDHYKDDCGDVMKLKDIPKNLTASRVIIAKPHWNNENKLEAGYMAADSIWNGVIHQDTTWDGKIKSALKAQKEDLKNAQEDYKKKNLPTPEWLCVTVDYHS